MLLVDSILFYYITEDYKTRISDANTKIKILTEKLEMAEEILSMKIDANEEYIRQIGELDSLERKALEEKMFENFKKLED